MSAPVTRMRLGGLSSSPAGLHTMRTAAAAVAPPRCWRSARRAAATRQLAVRAAYVSPATQAPPGAQQRLSLELPTADFQAVQLTALRRRRGGTAILIQEVPPGSASEAAGVRPGQQVLAVSDPIRAGEIWDIGGLASLRYVRQAVEGRALDTIAVRLTTDPAPEWQQAAAAARATVAAAGGATSTEGEQLTADERAELLAQLASMDASAQGAKKAAREEKLEQRAALERENREQQRSSAPFFAAFVGLFIGLPAVIVLLALSSGYLDSLGPR
ncbi:hypothetical protein ABPG75_011424 [Micractinium tetrahymenae]